MRRPPRKITLLACTVTLCLTIYSLQRHTSFSRSFLLTWILDDESDFSMPGKATNSTAVPRNPHDFLTETPNDTFSACLLVMDENHRLAEWIAYHYFALPLRYLVIAVDPQSRTSPTKLLDQWRSRMTIIEWTDSDFTNASLWRHESDHHDVKKNKHRERQNSFYQVCAWHLHQQNRTWTTFHDSDEFLTINGDFDENNETGMESGFVLKRMTKYASESTPEHPFWQSHFNRTCVTIPRALYGAVESDQEQIERDVPTDIVDPRQFDTLRWRYRATGRGISDGLAKSVMDVSRVNKGDFDNGGNAHRVSKKICPSAWIKYGDLPLGIHHYLGGWESYSFREDARKGTLRSYETWLERSTIQKGGPDDIIRPWIRGFIDMVGASEAQSLLLDAGLPPGYRVDKNITESWKSIL